MTRRAIFLAAVCLAPVLCAALTACGPQVGAREFPVTLDTEPPGRGARAYVILWDDWLKAGGPAALDDEAFLRKHEVRARRTPVTVNRPSYSYVYVAEIDGRYFVSDRFTPRMGMPPVTASVE